MTVSILRIVTALQATTAGGQLSVRSANGRSPYDFVNSSQNMAMVTTPFGKHIPLPAEPHSRYGFN